MKVVLSKYSKSSFDDIEQLFEVIFPDSKVAESLACRKTKSRHIINYGFAPNFLQLVNKFNDVVETLDQFKLLQISSDGPSLNLKFYKYFK